RLAAGTWVVFGAWLLLRGVRVAPRLGGHAQLLGATAVAWGLAQVLDEAPRPLPVGGWLFAIAFVLFALRLLGTRAASQPAPSQGASVWLSDSFYALRAVGLFLFGLPLWVSCTLAEPVIGDPAITYQVVNATDHPIDFFISAPRRSYPVHIAAGATRESGTLAHGAYAVVANRA